MCACMHVSVYCTYSLTQAGTCKWYDFLMQILTLEWETSYIMFIPYHYILCSRPEMDSEITIQIYPDPADILHN